LIHDPFRLLALFGKNRPRAVVFPLSYNLGAHFARLDAKADFIGNAICCTMTIPQPGVPRAAVKSRAPDAGTYCMYHIRIT
jgi:cytochrome c